jgi:hypothetical protein
MGLFKRARSLHRASRAANVGGGLLQKSLHFLDKVFSPSSDPAKSVGQAELDPILAVPTGALEEVPTGIQKQTPESVPRTWKESGQEEKLEEIESDDDLAGSAADKLEELLARLSELEDGIEAPGRFFSLVKEQLRLKRAALLLYDPVRMVFAPWATYGFDETTNHHLRIPLGANETMNRLAAGKVFLLSDPDTLKRFQQFFSFREFSTLVTLLLVPFIHENKFMGILLIADPERDFSQGDLSAFETLAVRASGLFYQARERHLEAAKRGVPEKSESLRESVQNAVQSCLAAGAPPIMIGVNTTNIIAKVKKRNPYIDPFRLREDIARVILSLFQSLGPVFHIDRERVLILVTHTPERDSELLLYHLKATLTRLLLELADQEEIDLEERVRIPEANVKEALTFLAEIV